MSRKIDTIKIAALTCAGIGTNVGGFMWTGIYMKHNGPVGFVLFTLGLAATGIFIGLVDKEPNKPQNRPPSQTASQGNSEERETARGEERELVALR